MVCDPRPEDTVAQSDKGGIGRNMGNPIIASPDARRVCTLSGLEQKRMAGKLLQLQDLEQTLDVALAEVTQAAKDEYFWRAMEVSAKLVQVSCDLAIAVLEEGAEKVGAGMGAKAVSVSYDVAKMVVDALNGDVSAKKALVFSTNAKLDAIAEHMSHSGNRYAKAVSRAKVLANLANDLYEYWGDGGRETLAARSSLVGARKTAYGQLVRIRLQIRETKEALVACELQ